MKNILILAGTYYPDSMATIGITQRFAEALSKEGYNVTVFVARSYDYAKKDYPNEHNGVKIIDCDEVSKSNNFSFKLRTRVNRVINRVFKALKIKGKLYQNLYKEPNYRIQECDLSKRVKTLIDKNGYDTVLSVALPFRIHRIGNRIKRICPHIRWITMSFDPYAYNEVTYIDRKKICIKEEEKIYAIADKVMFLSQFANDYKDSKFKNLITYFDLPNVRELKSDNNFLKINYSKDKINCIFLGNFFLIQRHPEFLFNLFYSLKNENVVLYIVGDFFEISKEYIDEWKVKLGDRLIIKGRVPQQAAINFMLDADVLINVGHNTTNQCPSKILDYISTGKPILNISKIDLCTSLPVLKKYPNTVTIYEKNGLTEDGIQKVEEFLAESKNKECISLEKAREVFSNFTMETMIKKFQDGE